MTRHLATFSRVLAQRDPVSKAGQRKWEPPQGLRQAHLDTRPLHLYYQPDSALLGKSG